MRNLCGLGLKNFSEKLGLKLGTEGQADSREVETGGREAFSVGGKRMGHRIGVGGQGSNIYCWGQFP